MIHFPVNPTHLRKQAFSTYPCGLPLESKFLRKHMQIRCGLTESSFFVRNGVKDEKYYDNLFN